MGDQRVLTEQEAAQFIRVTVHALRAWRWRKESDGPPFVKMGSCVRYRTRDLEAYLESHAVSHTKSGNVQPRGRRRGRKAA
jgi:predicted DNA-binding transcriptional regulator AlpA